MEVTEIIQDFINKLETLGFPVYQYGSQPRPCELPNTFFTFRIVDIEERAHADDTPFLYVFDIVINIFTVDITKLYIYIEKFKKLMTTLNCVIDGYGRDIYVQETYHTGRELNVNLIIDIIGEKDGRNRNYRTTNYRI